MVEPFAIAPGPDKVCFQFEREGYYTLDSGLHPATTQYGLPVFHMVVSLRGADTLKSQ